jgi:hypothetical protein
VIGITIARLIFAQSSDQTAEYSVVTSTQETTVQDNQKNIDRELSDADLELVSGGINPQPLPPCHPPEERLK